MGCGACFDLKTERVQLSGTKDILSLPRYSSDLLGVKSYHVRALPMCTLPAKAEIIPRLRDTVAARRYCKRETWNEMAVKKTCNA